MILWYASYESAPGCICTMGSFPTQSMAAASVVDGGIPKSGAFVWPVGEPGPDDTQWPGEPVTIQLSPDTRELERAEDAIDAALRLLESGDQHTARDVLDEWKKGR